MKQITSVSSDKIAIVDDEDYEYLKNINWVCCLDKKTKFDRHLFQTSFDIMHGGKMQHSTILMARMIMKATPDDKVLHIDGNTLDNRKSNLVSVHTTMIRNTKHKSIATSYSWDKIIKTCTATSKITNDNRLKIYDAMARQKHISKINSGIYEVLSGRYVASHKNNSDTPKTILTSTQPIGSCNVSDDSIVLKINVTEDTGEVKGVFITLNKDTLEPLGKCYSACPFKNFV